MEFDYPDYTPGHDVPPFYAWVQRTLPAVYDDGLSYQEMFGKVIYLINSLIQSNNDNTSATNTFIAFLKNFFDNLDVDQEISDKLDQMAESGQLQELVEGIFTELKTDMSNLEKWAQSKLSLKVDKGGNEQITWGMLAQSVKEQITGGSAAVVGTDAVNTTNIVNKAVTNPKLSDTFFDNETLIGTGTDMNTVKRNGTYPSSGATNAPADGLGILTVQTANSAGNVRVVQTFQNLTTPNMTLWERYSLNDGLTWSDWVALPGIAHYQISNDANECENGLFVIPNTGSNLPAKQLTMLFSAKSVLNSVVRTMQMAFTNGAVFTRRNINGTWDAWMQAGSNTASAEVRDIDSTESGGFLGSGIYAFNICVGNENLKRVTQFQIPSTAGDKSVYIRLNTGSWSDRIPINSYFSNMTGPTGSLNDYADGLFLSINNDDRPMNATNYGLVETKTVSVLSNIRKVQTYADPISGIVHTRTNNNGVWSDWSDSAGGGDYFSTMKVCVAGDSIFGLNQTATGVVGYLSSNVKPADYLNIALGGTRMVARGEENFKYYDGQSIIDALVSGDFTNQEAHLSDEGVPSYFAESITRMKGLDLSGYDLFVFNWGTNDWTASVDINTYKSTMLESIAKLQAKYPNLAVIAVGCAMRFIDDNGTVKDSETYEYNSQPLSAFNSAKLESSEALHIPCIDVYDIGINIDNYTAYFDGTDYTHQNEKGRFLLARKIGKELF